MASIITIGRQHGSEGARIGRELARQLGFAYYDKELLRTYALEKGWEKTLMDSYGERHASSLLLALSTGSYSFGYYDPANSGAISQKPFQLAFETIKEVARQGDCVIVGRCADYVLRDHPACFHLFVHAPLGYRTSVVAQRQGTGEEEAAQIVRETDRLRQSFYNYYTDKSWGASDGYHMTMDSSLLGAEETARFLQDIIVRGGAGMPQRSAG